MNPLLIPLLLKGGTGLLSLLLGGKQEREAKALEKQNVRPTETVPQGVLDATAQMKLLSEVGLPGAQVEAAKRDIDRAANKAISGATDRRMGVDLISTIQQGTDDANLNLQGKIGEARIANTQSYAQQLNTLGQFQNQVWNWNFAQKFIENADAIRALKGSGMQNQNVGLEQLFGAGADASALLGGQTGGSTKTTDPTLTSPDLFSTGIPSQYGDYLKNLNALRKYRAAS